MSGISVVGIDIIGRFRGFIYIPGSDPGFETQIGGTILPPLLFFFPSSLPDFSIAEILKLQNMVTYSGGHSVPWYWNIEGTRTLFSTIQLTQTLLPKLCA